MSDYLLAIWAQPDTCKPYTGPGRVGHVVRINTANSAMTVINEFATGGSFSHSSCAPCSAQSWLLDRTSTRVSLAEIEKLAKTSASGTTFENLQAAIIQLGQGASFGSTFPAGNIMNPGGGYIDPVSDFPAYLAARQAGSSSLVLTVVTAPVPPIPPGGSDDMWLYQDAANTIWLVQGGSMLALGEPADVKVFLGRAGPVVTHAELSPTLQTRLGKLPKIT